MSPIGNLAATVDALEQGFYALLIMGFGLAVVGYSYSRHKERRLIQDTPTAEVESMSVGAVELNGTVEKAESAVSSLLTDEACAVIDYDIDEHRWSDDGKEWKTQDAGVIAEPFYLNDGTDRVLVDSTEWSTDYDISDDNRIREEYAEAASHPDHLASFIETHTDLDVESDYDRRYTQEIIPIGTEAYVFGDAEIADDVDPDVDPESDLVVTEDQDTELFLVSDKDEDDLVEDRRYSLALGGLLGVGIFVVGLWWFLSVLGV